MKVEFKEFVKVFGEKHLGVATVILDDKFMFRYKVSPGKDGKGFYCKPATHKMGEEYIPSFIIDSNFITESIMNCLRDNVRGLIDDGVPF